jgi:hypothetical protein
VETHAPRKEWCAPRRRSDCYETVATPIGLAQLWNALGGRYIRERWAETLECIYGPEYAMPSLPWVDFVCKKQCIYAPVIMSDMDYYYLNGVSWLCTNIIYFE